MTVTVLLPEAIFAKAVTDYLSARWNTSIIRADFADQDAIEWTTTHSFLADMGGFAIRFPPSHTGEDQRPAAADPRSERSSAAGTQEPGEAAHESLALEELGSHSNGVETAQSTDSYRGPQSYHHIQGSVGKSL